MSEPGSSKQILLSTIGIAVLIVVLTGITYSFFNYTRTGDVNTLSVGRISFSTTSGPTINISNVFPIDSDDIDTETDYVGSVNINVAGDTDYSEGVEYLVSAVDVINDAGTTEWNHTLIPISLDISYSANTGKTIGTENSNYFNEGVRGGNTSYYKILTENVVRSDDELLVGYIAPGSTGIDGNITIKAYLDKDKILISDTYPEGDTYELNPNITSDMINACVSYIDGLGWSSFLLQGETLYDYCAGTGTVEGSTMLHDANYGYARIEKIQTFAELGILIISGTNGTTNASGKVVLTTNNWNSFQASGLSFKIKVEANKGIWVDEPGKIDTCPGCKFIFSKNTPIYTTWNTINQEPTVLTTGVYDSYLDITNGLFKNMFYGVVLNENNEITRAYGCGIWNDVPYCLEDTPDGSAYTRNQEILEEYVNLSNNSCQVSGTGDNEAFKCPSGRNYVPTPEVHIHGCVNFSTYYTDEMGTHSRTYCDTDYHGVLYCYNSKWVYNVIQSGD